MDDDAFVRAPIGQVFTWIGAVDGYDRWWPGWRTLGAEGEATAVKLEPESPFAPRLRVRVRPHTVRPGIGLHLGLTGDLTGEAEWWLEDVPGGTVVHHLLRATTTRHPRRTLQAYRRCVRRAFWALKDGAQAEVRDRVGLLP